MRLTEALPASSAPFRWYELPVVGLYSNPDEFQRLRSTPKTRLPRRQGTVNSADRNFTRERLQKLMQWLLAVYLLVDPDSLGQAVGPTSVRLLY